MIGHPKHYRVTHAGCMTLRVERETDDACYIEEESSNAPNLDGSWSLRLRSRKHALKLVNTILILYGYPPMDFRKTCVIHEDCLKNKKLASMCMQRWHPQSQFKAQESPGTE